MGISIGNGKGMGMTINFLGNGNGNGNCNMGMGGNGIQKSIPADLYYTGHSEMRNVSHTEYMNTRSLQCVFCCVWSSAILL